MRVVIIEKREERPPIPRPLPEPCQESPLIASARLPCSLERGSTSYQRPVCFSRKDSIVDASDETSIRRPARHVG